MKIYTKTGDQGKTSLYGGERVSKDSVEIDAVGVLDEVSSWLGVIVATSDKSNKIDVKTLQREQHNIFIVSSYIAMIKDAKLRNTYILSDKVVQTLEKEIDNWQNSLKPLKQFILPGGSELASEMFLARTVVRRAERIIIKLNEKYLINQKILKYLNRLSDWMFVLARYQNKQSNVSDILWEK